MPFDRSRRPGRCPAGSAAARARARDGHERRGWAMRLIRLALILLLAGLSLPARPAAAQATPVPGPCQRFTGASGAIELICRPAKGWNGEPVVFAHPYGA